MLKEGVRERAAREAVLAFRATEPLLRDIADAIEMIERFTEWREIRGIGNWLRHQYERIELPVIFKTIRDDLPPLKAAVLRALLPSSANPKGPFPS
jgi:uncharacterized protein with HEPN domain